MMITRHNLAYCIAQATIFARQADAALRELQLAGDDHPSVGTKRTGAVRRASMDLTRALAILRRPPSQTAPLPADVVTDDDLGFKDDDPDFSEVECAVHDA